MREKLLALILATSPMFATAPKPRDDRRWKVLLVVAHPDDEYYFAATVYRIAQELGGVVDQLIITNGEGGYRYSALAEKVYGVALTDERTGRRRLPEIRRKETLDAGKILGVRHHYFLNEHDRRFTLAASEALNGGIWNCAKIRQHLRALLESEQYDFVFTLTPRSSEHGHHQAATLLALEAVQEIEPSKRPVVLAAEPGVASEPVVFGGLEGFPLATPVHTAPEFTFNRRSSFGYHDALSYEIVVQWVISAHKSQGMFQNDSGKHDVEQFWLFPDGPTDAQERTAALARQLSTASREVAPVAAVAITSK